MSSSLDRIAGFAGLPRLLRRRHRSALRIVMYHGVVPEPLTPFCWHQLGQTAFERQIAWLARTMDVLPLEEALERREAGSLPPNPCAITFDDGLRNNLTHALPVLERYRVPATIFLVTHHVGTDKLLWPDLTFRLFEKTRATSVDTGPLGLGMLPLATREENESTHAKVVLALKRLDPARRDQAIAHIRDSLGMTGRLAPGPFALLDREEIASMEASGLVRFGAHTRTHPILAHCDEQRLASEIEGSLDDLETLVGNPSPVFAYPNGRGIDFDERAQAMLTARGVRFAVSTEMGLARADRAALALPRIAVGANLALPRLRLLVSGLRG